MVGLAESCALAGREGEASKLREEALGVFKTRLGPMTADSIDNTRPSEVADPFQRPRRCSLSRLARSYQTIKTMRQLRWVDDELDTVRAAGHDIRQPGPIARAQGVTELHGIRPVG